MKFCYLYLAIAIAIAPVLAQETLEPTIVQGSSTSTPTLTHGTPESDFEQLRKVPGGTEVVNAERFLTGRASTLADTFYLSPGVVAQPRFGSDEARISIRGSGLQRTFHGRGIICMQDGVPLNLADGGFDMQSVDPLAASHINVWRGGNALAQGSTTLGGAIDFISRTGINSPGYSARLEGGSYGYLRARLAAGLLDGNKDFYFSLSANELDGFRDNSEQSAQRFFGNFGLNIHEDLETRFYFTAINTDSDLPGNLTKTELEDDPRMANDTPFGSVAYKNQRNFELYRFANITALQSGSNTIRLQTAWTYKDLDHPITPFVGFIDQLSNDFFTSLTFTNEDDLVGRENRFRSGIRFSYGETNAATLANNLGNRGDLRTKDDQTASNLDIFFENEHHFTPELALTTSIAATYATRDNDRKFTKTAPIPGPFPGLNFFTPPSATDITSYDDDYFNIAPNIGVVYKKNDVQYFAGFSRSFEPPSFAEAVTNNIARNAQTANTFEIGTRGTQSFARWDATVYYSEIKDELLAITDPVTLESTTRNADETIHYGIELGSEIDLLGSSWIEDDPVHRFVLRSAYTYGSFRFDGDPIYGDNRITGIPPHLLRGELLYENARGYYVGPTFEWSPIKSFIDHSNTFTADPYALLGFKFGRRVEDGVSWFVEVKNLTDETYSATHGVIDDAGGVNQRQFLPGDGRSVFAGLEWKF